MKVLVTGVLGFIFSNFVRDGHWLDAGHQLVGLDKAARPHNMANMPGMSIPFYMADICDAHVIDRIFDLEKPEMVIGGAAESFVDDSITDIAPFLQSNIIGTQTLVNACLKHGVKRYVHISTDEVYGQKADQSSAGWTEMAPMKPRNPYSASKACAEHIVHAAHNTHGLQFQITRSCNVFGPRQKRQNLVPHVITSITEGSSVHLHGTGDNFRQYIYVRDLISALWTIIERGGENETYNIAPAHEGHVRTNLDMVHFIAGLMYAWPRIDFIADRKGHDWGYLVDASKLRALGWDNEHTMIEGMRETIAFYRENIAEAA